MACAGAAVAERDWNEIAFHRTPGKPMKLFVEGRPAEAIAVRRDAEAGYALSVRVNVPREGVVDYREWTAPLDRADWDRVVAIVRAGDLARWEPSTASDPVIDWGEAGYLLAAGSASVRRRWIVPAPQGAPPHALRQALVELAHEHLPEARLYYLE